MLVDMILMTGNVKRFMHTKLNNRPAVQIENEAHNIR